MKNGDFQAVNFAGTAAGIQAAIDAIGTSGGEIRVAPGTYAFGTSQISIQSNDISIIGMGGNRSAVLTYTGSGDFITFGADDGNHSGSTQGYNGLSTRCRLENLQISGPGSATTARAIVDWEGGSQVFRNLTINAWGYGFFGIGSDTNAWENCYFSANGYGAHLASRSDQNQFTNCYFTGSVSAGLLLEYAEGCRIFGGQFVGNTYDIIVDAPASPTGAADIRTDCGLYVAGAWFESLSATPTTSHIYIGRNGASGRLSQGFFISGCYCLVASSGCLLEVDAATNINIKENFQAGANFTTSLVKVNSVSGVSPVILARDNRITGSTVFGGAAATGALLGYERYQKTTNAVTSSASITVNMDGGGEIIEVSALGANATINAPTNPRRGMTRTWVFTQNGTGGFTVTWNAVFKQGWSDTGNTAGKRSTITFYYDGTNWNQVGAQSPYV